MRIKIYLGAVLCSIFMVLSCSSKTSDSVVPSTNNANSARKELPKIYSDSVVLKIGGTEYTRDDYEQYISLILALYENKKGSATAEQKAKMLKSIRYSGMQDFTTRMLKKAVIEEQKFEPTEKEVKFIERKYTRAFAAKGQKFSDIRKKMADCGKSELFDQEVKIDTRFETLMRTTLSNEFAVTEKELAQVKKDVMDFNACAMATNAATEALASKILLRIAAGEPFDKLADQYSQDGEKNPGGYMGQRVETDLNEESAAYCEAIRNLKDGETSKLLVTESGYEIVRKNKTLGPNDSDSGLTAYDTSRIFLRRAYVFPEQSDEDFKADVMVEKRQKVMAEFLKKQFKTRLGQFPFGANGFKGKVHQKGK